MKVSPFVKLVLVFVTIFAISWVANGDMTPSQCDEEVRQLKNACYPVVFGSKPSATCCARVRAAHVECVCPKITPKLAALLGVTSTIKKIEACGRPVPHHFKCGSVTTP